MIISYTRYLSSGEIMGHVSILAENRAQHERDNNELLLEGEFDRNKYYINSNIQMAMPRLVNPSEIDVTAINVSPAICKITKIPSDSTITIDRKSYQLTDKFVELSFNMPGIKRIVVESLKYLPVTLEVAVN